MPRALGLGFDLQRIITGGADAVVGVDALKGSSVRERWETAAHGVAGDHPACAGATKYFRLTDLPERARCGSHRSRL